MSSTNENGAAPSAYTQAGAVYPNKGINATFLPDPAAAATSASSAPHEYDPSAGSIVFQGMKTAIPETSGSDNTALGTGASWVSE